MIIGLKSIKKRISQQKERLNAYETRLASGEEGPLEELLTILEAASALPAGRPDVLDILIPVNIHIGLHSRCQNPADAFLRAQVGIQERITTEGDWDELNIAHSACRTLAENPADPYAPSWLVEHGFIRGWRSESNAAAPPQEVDLEEYLGRELPY